MLEGSLSSSMFFSLFIFLSISRTHTKHTLFKIASLMLASYFSSLFFFFFPFHLLYLSFNLSHLPLFVSLAISLSHTHTHSLPHNFCTSSVNTNIIFHFLHSIFLSLSLCLVVSLSLCLSFFAPLPIAAK